MTAILMDFFDTLGQPSSGEAVIEKRICPIGSKKYRLYVNSWGRDRNDKFLDCAGVKSSGTILCTTEENPIPKITEVSHAEANSLQGFRLVVAAFNEAIRPGDIHRMKNLVEPVAVCFGTIVEFRKIHNLNSPKPVNEQWFP